MPGTAGTSARVEHARLRQHGELASPEQQVFVDVNGQLGTLGPPGVSQPISGRLNAVARDRALEAPIEALEALVRQ